MPVRRRISKKRRLSAPPEGSDGASAAGNGGASCPPVQPGEELPPAVQVVMGPSPAPAPAAPLPAVSPVVVPPVEVPPALPPLGVPPAPLPLDPALPLPAEDSASGLGPDRKLYKLVHTRLYRRMEQLRRRPPGLLSALEQTFLDAPGPTMSTDRMRLFADLIGADDAMHSLVMDMVHRAQGGELRGPGRPSNSSLQSKWPGSNQFLLTYNGDWGLMPFGTDTSGGADAVARRVRLLPECQRLAVQVQQWVDRLVEKPKHPLMWAWALEVSPDSLRKGVVRLHLHLAMAARFQPSHRRQLPLPPYLDFIFLNSAPVRGETSSGRIATRATFVQMFHYILVGKIGCVMHRGNVELHKDLLVNPAWAFQLLQQSKITEATAKSICVNSVKGASDNVRQLESWSRLRQEAAEETLLRDVALTLAERACPFRVLPEVQEWLEQYHHIRRRYQFLVLEGPSMVGKTAYVESLVPRDALLMVDCAASVEPDLKQFDSSVHELVLMDEAKVELVLRCKRLFQAPNAMVALGQSATNVHAYQRCLWRKKLVVCSNTWSGELAKLCEADAGWLRANTVHVLVKDQLWIGPPVERIGRASGSSVA